jgi:hypothetical protein
VLEECGHEVLVANPPKRRLICTKKLKTDEIAAENLAHLARLDQISTLPAQTPR